MKPRILIIFLLIVAVSGCMKAAPETEPVYDGWPLSECVVYSGEQNLDGTLSTNAIKAANGLHAIGAAAVPWLIKWIENPNSPTGMYVASTGTEEAFKTLGPQATVAIPPLAKILNKKFASMDDYTSWHEAAESISWLGPAALPDMLTTATNLQGTDDQWELIQSIGNLGTNGEPAIPALIGWTSDTNSWVRTGAVTALGDIAMDPETVIPVLLRALKDPEPMVRSYASDALGNYGKTAQGAVPDLIQKATDADPQVRASAMMGLGEIGEPRHVVLPILITGLSDDDPTVRRMTAYALGEFGGQKAFEALIQATDDPAQTVREAVFQSLKKIDPAQLAKSGKKFY